jgi:glucokinase
LRELAGGTGEFSPLHVAKLAEAGDSSARLAFEQLGTYLGIGISLLINTLDLPLIVVGGGVAATWPLFAGSMFKSVYDHSVVYRLTAPTQTLTIEQDHAFICQAVLGPSAGLLGAALLPHLHGLADLSTPFSFSDYEVAN